MSFLFQPELVLNNATYNNSEFRFRPLHIDDYDLGYSELLQQLTEAKFEKSQFIERFLQMQKEATNYYVVVVEDLKKKKIIATGTVFIERKFIRNCGSVGHIEDIVVDSTYRGKNLGLKIIEQLKYIGCELGCYKVILDCEEKNEKFYEKCGFTKKQIMMAIYFPKKQSKL